MLGPLQHRLVILHGGGALVVHQCRAGGVRVHCARKVDVRGIYVDVRGTNVDVRSTHVDVRGAPVGRAIRLAVARTSAQHDRRATSAPV
eukprot:182958-Prorocentrum_minimum.AAC.1